MTSADELKALGHSSRKDHVRSVLICALGRLRPHPNLTRYEIDAELQRSREDIEYALKLMERNW